MTESEFRQKLAAEKFPQPVAVERDATYVLDTHQHPFEAWALVTDGDITLEVDGKKTTYRAGETFRLPPNLPHREAAGAQGVKYLSGRKETA